MGKYIFQDCRIEISFKIYSTFEFCRWWASYWQLKGLGARLSFVTHWLCGLAWPPVFKWRSWTWGLLGPAPIAHSWVLWLVFRYFIIRVTLFFMKCSKRFNKLFAWNIFLTLVRPNQVLKVCTVACCSQCVYPSRCVEGQVSNTQVIAIGLCGRPLWLRWSESSS